jgi:hypothetical protein
VSEITEYQLMDHVFLHGPDGWVCRKCSRLWCNVVAGQPSFPGHRHMDDEGNRLPEPMGQGIACVGDMNAAERDQRQAEIERIWTALLDAAGRGYKTTAAEPEE